jgi:hypothetical protein
MQVKPSQVGVLPLEVSTASSLPVILRAGRNLYGSPNPSPDMEDSVGHHDDASEETGCDIRMEDAG